jgi:hypothetical protein
VVGGAIALVAASVSYYAAGTWFEGMAFSYRSSLVWSAAGVAAGAALGAAGFAARHDRRHRSLALAALAGCVLGEGVHLTWWVTNEGLRSVGLAELVLAAVIGSTCVRARTWTTPVIAIASATSLATLLSFELIARALSVG